jgi:hypothetical protein
MMTSSHEGLKRKGWDISSEDLCTWKREITLYLRDALVLCSMKDNSSNKNEITAIIPSILYANRCDYSRNASYSLKISTFSLAPHLCVRASLCFYDFSIIIYWNSSVSVVSFCFSSVYHNISLCNIYTENIFFSV